MTDQQKDQANIIRTLAGMVTWSDPDTRTAFLDSIDVAFDPDTAKANAEAVKAEQEAAAPVVDYTTPTPAEQSQDDRIAALESRLAEAESRAAGPSGPTEPVTPSVPPEPMTPEQTAPAHPFPAVTPPPSQEQP